MEAEPPRSRRSSSKNVMNTKLFIIHLKRLGDEEALSKLSLGETLWDYLSRSLYRVLTRKGHAEFESQYPKLLRKGLSGFARHVEGLLAPRLDTIQQACLEDICPSLTAIHAIRECTANEISVNAASEVLIANDLSGKVELVFRRLQFEAQKLLWNMFLGNRGYVEARSSDELDGLDYNEKARAVIMWVYVLELLFNDSQSECSKYIHNDEAFAAYTRHEDVAFRGKWLRFKTSDQDNGGILTYRLNVKALSTLMSQGHSLDDALVRSLRDFSRQLTDFPAQVQNFAHFYYGKSYGHLLKELLDKDEAARELVSSLNHSPVPSRTAFAAGILTGGFLLHQLSYLPAAANLELNSELYTGELESLEHCTSTNLRVLAMVRSMAREHHKENLKALTSRLQEELGRSQEDADRDIAALLWYVREEVPMLIHRNFRSLIPMMLTLDHYQSGHEANSFDPSRSVPRSEWEAKISADLYKADVATMDEKRERPKYGALNVVKDVLGIPGGVFYGATYITLKNMRRLATFSANDSASPSVLGITGDDCIISSSSGSECDLGTLDYSAGVICNGWSKNFLRVAIDVAHEHLGSPEGREKGRRKSRLERVHSQFMSLPGDEGIRQYDEFQIHGQILFAQNVDSLTVGKPLVPDKSCGKLVECDGKLVVMNPVTLSTEHYDTSPSERRKVAESDYDLQRLLDAEDDYFLFYTSLALMDDFDGLTPAFDKQVKAWSEDKTDQFRKHVLDQQSKMVALGALVRLDIPDHGPRYCFHLKKCLECIGAKYPSVKIHRIVTDSDTWRFSFERSESKH